MMSDVSCPLARRSSCCCVLCFFSFSSLGDHQGDRVTKNSLDFNEIEILFIPTKKNRLRASLYLIPCSLSSLFLSVGILT